MLFYLIFALLALCSVSNSLCSMSSIDATLSLVSYV